MLKISVKLKKKLGDIQTTNSPSSSISPPGSEASPHNEMKVSPSSPQSLSPNSGHNDRRKSPQQHQHQQQQRLAATPYSPNRDYSFNNFHTQPGHVGSEFINLCLVFSKIR